MKNNNIFKLSEISASSLFIRRQIKNKPIIMNDKPKHIVVISNKNKRKFDLDKSFENNKKKKYIN